MTTPAGHGSRTPSAGNANDALMEHAKPHLALGGTAGQRDRRGEVLFIDCKNLGKMVV